jgi:hypothetical protein
MLVLKFIVETTIPLLLLFLNELLTVPASSFLVLSMMPR